MFKSLTLKKFLPFALVLVVLASIIGSGLYFYNQQRNNTQDAKAGNSDTITLDNTQGALCPLVLKDGVAQHVCDKPLKLNLIVATSTSTDYQNWSPLSYSNNSQFTQWTCGKDNLFNGKKVLGIVDYEDGILTKFLKNNPVDAQYQELDVHSRHSQRNCGHYNQLSTSGRSICGVDYRNVKTGDEIYNRLNPNIPRPSDGCGFTPPLTAISPNNPVYAFQYRYEYNFTGDLKTKTLESERFRSFTNKEGVYDGVVLTYTYYTYPNCLDKCPIANQGFRPWEVPTKDNKWGGWLIYGVGGSSNPPVNGQVYNANLSKNKGTVPINGQGGNILTDTINLEYNSGTKEMKYSGEYNFDQIGCGQSIVASFGSINYLVNPGPDAPVYSINIDYKSPANYECAPNAGKKSFSGTTSLEIPQDRLAKFNKLFSGWSEAGSLGSNIFNGVDLKTVSFARSQTLSINTKDGQPLTIKRNQGDTNNKALCLAYSNLYTPTPCIYVEYRTPSCTPPADCPEGLFNLTSLVRLFSYLGPIDTLEKAQFLNQATNTSLNMGVAKIGNDYVIKTQIDCSDTVTFTLIKNQANTYELQKLYEYKTGGPVACT